MLTLMRSSRIQLNRGVGSVEIDGWKQSYYSMKQAAQSSAIGQIEKALTDK